MRYQRKTIYKKPMEWLAIGLILIAFVLGALVNKAYQGYQEKQKEIKSQFIFGNPDFISPLGSIPLIVEPAQVKLAVVKISQDTQDVIVDKIAKLESTSGKYGLAKTCEAKGMVNWWGYRSSEGFCFTTWEEGYNTVFNWLTSHQKQGLSLAQMLCHYNRGTVSEDCQYYQSYLKI